jgi:hypothetical protein
MDWIPKLTHNDENRHNWKICASGRNFQMKVSYVNYSDSKDADNMVGLAESFKGKKTVSCHFGKKELEDSALISLRLIRYLIYCFSKGQIKLSQFHTMPSAEDLKRMKYCKWHNATSHNGCIIFIQQIQSAIEQGKLEFETPTEAENPIKIDQHPFPTNTVEVSSKGSSHVKLLLTSKLAQNKRAVDPNVQATTADVKGKRVAT